MKHGTITMATTGGCREDCCRPIASRYTETWRLRKLRGIEVVVDSARSVRKVRALRALGWTESMLAAEMGMSQQSLNNVVRRARIKATTAQRIDALYARLEMVIPPDTRYTRESRARAQANGWAPPLAWDDIDSGVLADQGSDATPYSRDRLDLDEVEIAISRRDFSRKLFSRERAEIVRRWKSFGYSELSLVKLTGWRQNRYATEGGLTADG